MMKRLLLNIRAAAAIEFALIAPAFIVLVIGIAQMGLVFMASAGLHNAVAQGARRATLFPRPTVAQVGASVDAAKFGLDSTRLSAPVVNYNTAASPNYADVQMSYTTSLNFILFTRPVTLTQRRRVYLQPLPAT
jgi:Flp pilus assembly protein TadG